METQFDSTRLDSPSWIFFVKISFACAGGNTKYNAPAALASSR